MGKKRKRIKRGGENPGSQWRKRSRNPKAHERMMTSSAKLVGRIVGNRLLAPGRKEEEEKEEEKEGEKGSIINIKMGNNSKEKMNYAIYDNKKIISRKNGNSKEERRRFYVKKERY